MVKDALTKDTVINTNIATIIVVVGMIIAMTGAWTTLMLRIGTVERDSARQSEAISELNAQVKFNREAFLTIQGDLKEIKARLP